MKTRFFATFMLFLLPSIGLAASADQCALDSTCSFSIHGKFNKQLTTPDLEAGKTYVCKVISGSGNLLSVQNVFASKGVSYTLKGSRLSKPFVIRGPKQGTGYIRYTLYNHNDPWHTDSFQFKCVESDK